MTSSKVGSVSFAVYPLLPSTLSPLPTFLPHPQNGCPVCGPRGDRRKLSWLSGTLAFYAEKTTSAETFCSCHRPRPSAGQVVQVVEDPLHVKPEPGSNGTATVKAVNLHCRRLSFSSWFVFGYKPDPHKTTTTTQTQHLTRGVWGGEKRVGGF